MGNSDKLKQPEEALKEMEFLLSESQRVAHIGGWCWYLTGSIRWTDETYRVYGVSPDTFTPTVESLVNLVHPEDRSAMQEWIRACSAGEKPGDLKFRSVLPDGTIRFLNGSGELFYDAENKPVRMTGTVQDITEREQIEQALRESEEKFSLAFHSSPAMIALAGLDGKFVDVNKTFTDFLGYPREEILGKSLVDLQIINEEERQKILELARKGGGSVYNAEIGVQLRDGSLRHVLFSLNTVPIGGVPHRLAALRDVTDLNRAKEEVKTINEELRTINRIITTSISVIDTKKMLDKILVEALDIVGLEGGVVCMLEPDDSLRLITQRASSEATITDLTTNRIKVGDCLCGNCAHDHCPLILPDRGAVMKYATREALRGEAINFHAAFPFISKGRSVGVLCVFTRTDKKPGERNLKLLETLTAQVALAIENAMFNEKIQQSAIELEQKVKERTAQLLAANKELESFSYSVSHDLRAPLRAISGFAEIIADRYRSGLNEEGRHYLDNIVVASTRMGHLIDDLLAYARLGRTALRHEPVALRSIFDIVASDLAVRLTETGGTLKIADALPTVMGDKTLLSRMFTNLVENALTYRKSDVPPQVEVTYQIKNGQVIVKVSDNGIGIPSEHYEKIFNIFQRLHSDDEHPGTGVGLAIVKKAVELLGGSVRVESEVGKGSMFLIELQRSDI